MSKRKIKIRYIVILPVLICALIFIRKLMKLNDLDAKEVAEIILVSPPYKKRITDQQEIEEFTRMFNNKKKRFVFSIINSSGWSKRAIISMGTRQYDIIFCGENITVNRLKYVMDESIDSELDQFYQPDHRHHAHTHRMRPCHELHAGNAVAGHGNRMHAHAGIPVPPRRLPAGHAGGHPYSQRATGTPVFPDD